MDFFILDVRRKRRIFTRNGCRFTTGQGGLVQIAVVRSDASRKQHGARFIVRIASEPEVESQWNPFDGPFAGL
jgi:hypothetical protein